MLFDLVLTGSWSLLLIAIEDFDHINCEFGFTWIKGYKKKVCNKCIIL